jgi:hypothetical protein
VPVQPHVRPLPFKGVPYVVLLVHGAVHLAEARHA